MEIKSFKLFTVKKPTHKSRGRGLSHYSTFARLWRSLLPSIIIMRPMTDLSWQCQKGSYAIQRSANLSDEKKTDIVLSAQEHLRTVKVDIFLHFHLQRLFPICESPLCFRLLLCSSSSCLSHSAQFKQHPSALQL